MPMKTNRGFRGAWLCWGIGVGLACCTVLSPATVSAQDKAKPASSEKKVTFELKDKSWSATFEWLSDLTGLPIVHSSMPTGTVSLVSSRARSYTVGEIIDLVNER